MKSPPNTPLWDAKRGSILKLSESVLKPYLNTDYWSRPLSAVCSLSQGGRWLGVMLVASAKPANDNSETWWSPKRLSTQIKFSIISCIFQFLMVRFDVTWMLNAQSSHDHSHSHSWKQTAVKMMNFQWNLLLQGVQVPCFLLVKVIMLSGIFKMKELLLFEIGNAKCHSWETRKAFVVIRIFQSEWMKFQQKTQARTGVKEWLLPWNHPLKFKNVRSKFTVYPLANL